MMLSPREWDDEAFRQEAEALPQSAWTHDASGRIDYVNRQFETCFGFGLSCVMNMLNWAQVMSPADFSGVLPEFSLAFREGHMFSREVRIKPLSTDDGVYRPYLLRIVPIRIDGRGKPVKWVGNAIDLGDDAEASPPAGEHEVLDVCLSTGDSLEAHRALDLIIGFIRERAGKQADYHAIRLIFFELLGNVLRHAPGRLMVRLEWFEESPRLHIFDRGQGFEFRPVLPAETLAESGRGLFIIQALTGSLVVHRLPGCGSHVSVVLPAQRLTS